VHGSFCIPPQVLTRICRDLSRALEDEKAFVTKYKADYKLLILVSTRKDTRQTDIRRPAILRKLQCIEYVVYLPYQEISESPHYLSSFSNYLLDAIKEILSKYQIKSKRLDETVSRLLKTISTSKKFQRLLDEKRSKDKLEQQWEMEVMADFKERKS
jgi:hypothetical protein